MKMYDLYKWGSINGVNKRGIMSINGVVTENYIELASPEDKCMHCGESAKYKYITIITTQEKKEEKVDFICEECAYC